MKCPFCEPVHVLFENGDSRIIANIFPAQLGHILVVPIRHVQKIGEMSGEEWMSFSLAARTAVNILEKCMTDQMNLIINQGEIAGQTVKHLHFSVIPRRPNDNLVNFSRKNNEKKQVTPLALGFLESIFQDVE